MKEDLKIETLKIKDISIGIAGYYDMIILRKDYMQEFIKILRGILRNSYTQEGRPLPTEWWVEVIINQNEIVVFLEGIYKFIGYARVSRKVLSKLKKTCGIKGYLYIDGAVWHRLYEVIGREKGMNGIATAPVSGAEFAKYLKLMAP